MAVHEDLPDLGVQDFRLWWERGAPSEATHSRLRVWKGIATMLMFVALTSIVILTLRASYPRPMKGLPDVSPVGVPAAGGSRGNETTTASDDVTPLRRWDQFSLISLLAFVTFVALALSQRPARGDDLVKHATAYRTARVDGLSVFCREAGPSDAPMLLLLHGFPSSSRMFEPLFTRLSDRYHLVSPDYPGFGRGVKA
jgi:hypothetical protein